MDFLPNCAGVGDGRYWIHKYSVHKVRRKLDMKIVVCYFFPITGIGLDLACLVSKIWMRYSTA